VKKFCATTEFDASKALREMCHRDMLIQHLTHMPNQLIHRKIRLIYVIVCIISILTVSSVRVKKFCATTEFDASKALATGFKAPYTLGEGLARTLEFEFVHPRTDEVTFKSE